MFYHRYPYQFHQFQNVENYESIHDDCELFITYFLATCAKTKLSVMLDPDSHTHIMNTTRIRNNDYRIDVEPGMTVEAGSGTGPGDTDPRSRSGTNVRRLDIKKLKNLWEWKTFGVRWAKGRVDQAMAAGSPAASYSCQKNSCLNREIIDLPEPMYFRTSFSEVMRR
jgi:hypothetical protein